MLVSATEKLILDEGLLLLSILAVAFIYGCVLYVMGWFFAFSLLPTLGETSYLSLMNVLYGIIISSTCNENGDLLLII